MVHKRNKYKKKNKRNVETIQVVPGHVDLPLHVIEKIIDFCDPYTKGRCATLSKGLKDFVGDARPKHLINQCYFLQLVKECCAQKFFYLRVLTPNYHMILSDENGVVVYIDIIPRNTLRRYHKPLKRCYRIAHATGALTSLLKGTRIFKGTDQIAGAFFETFFREVYDISMSTNDPPHVFLQWKHKLACDENKNKN